MKIFDKIKVGGQVFEMSKTFNYLLLSKNLTLEFGEDCFAITLHKNWSPILIVGYSRVDICSDSYAFPSVAMSLVGIRAIKNGKHKRFNPRIDKKTLILDLTPYLTDYLELEDFLSES